MEHLILAYEFKNLLILKYRQNEWEDIDGGIEKAKERIDQDDIQINDKFTEVKSVF